MRIVYVEDNDTNLFLVQRIARMGQHEVIHYRDGKHTLDCYAGDHPDLILIDLQLLGTFDGLDVVRALREMGCRAPIIALTAYAMIGDRERCLEAGCDDYIAKPLPVATLVEVFQRYANHRESG
jgi:CheY-like chemotaxis protein